MIMREREMAGQESEKLSEAHPMNSGDGLYSYVKNSSFQRGVIDNAKELIQQAIKEKLRIEDFSSNTFRVADLGCSVGPNTFFATQNIIDTVELKCQSQQRLNFHHPEYQVFFNDHSSNDFNTTLFASLPHDRQYYVVGVPGSFYQRLFPIDSLHLVHSSYALQWLSKVPKEIIDRSSLAWNKGRIHYINAPAEVVNAYTTQYSNDMESFFHSRAQEIVGGGLMLLTIPCHPNGTPYSQTLSEAYDLLTSCLMDLVKKGLTSEEQVDFFNIPIYYASPQELEVAISKNGCFNIERIENLPNVQSQDHDSKSKAQLFTFHVRAAMGTLLANYFGHEILDELFQLYQKKLEESSIFESGSSRNAINLFVVLKRKATS